MTARILTVKNPWAFALIHGGKTVENRPRNIAGDYRGPVLIHIALHPDDEPHRLRSWPALEAVMDGVIATDDTLTPGDMPWQRGAGHIVGVVDLVDVHRTMRSTVPARMGAPVCWDDHTPPGQLCSPWAEPDGHHLVFANPRALAEPIPYTGALGMRRSPFEVAGEWVYRNTYQCSCPAGWLGEEVGHTPGCGLETAGHLVATGRIDGGATG